MNGKFRNGRGITRVAVPTIEGDQEVVTKDEIELRCLEEASRRFTQAQNTPMLQEPLLTELGKEDDGPAIPAILNGTYQAPAGVDEFTQALLPFFKRPEQVRDAVSTVISTDDFINGWEKMKERTSGGRSGIHFGMMKAIVKARDLADVEATLANIRFVFGKSLDRWKNGTNVML